MCNFEIQPIDGFCFLTKFESLVVLIKNLNLFMCIFIVDIFVLMLSCFTSSLLPSCFSLSLLLLPLPGYMD